jgi:hypothetical protein
VVSWAAGPHVAFVAIVTLIGGMLAQAVELFQDLVRHNHSLSSKSSTEKAGFRHDKLKSANLVSAPTIG